MASDTPGVRAWPTVSPESVEAVLLKGGLICTTTRERLADGRVVVVKRCPYPAEVEAEGLMALAAAGAPTPAVLGTAADVLVLEYVSGSPDWAGLGRAMATVHRTTADRYGWHRDNPAGRFDQRNDWSEDWQTFFVERRILAHLADPEVPAPIAERLRAACAGPLKEMLPADPPASLTHGDLWSATSSTAGGWSLPGVVSPTGNSIWRSWKPAGCPTAVRRLPAGMAVRTRLPAAQAGVAATQAADRTTAFRCCPAAADRRSARPLRLVTSAIESPRTGATGTGPG